AVTVTTTSSWRWRAIPWSRPWRSAGQGEAWIAAGTRTGHAQLQCGCRAPGAFSGGAGRPTYAGGDRAASCRRLRAGCGSDEFRCGKSSALPAGCRLDRYLARQWAGRTAEGGDGDGPGGPVEHPVAGARNARTASLQAGGGATGARRWAYPLAGARDPGGRDRSGTDPVDRGHPRRRGGGGRYRPGPGPEPEPWRTRGVGRRAVAGPAAPAPARVPHAHHRDHRARRGEPRPAHRGPAGRPRDDARLRRLGGDLRPPRAHRRRGATDPPRRRGDVT